MRKGVRVSGTFLGISPQAWETLAPLLGGYDEVAYESDQRRVSVDHEGWRADLEDLARAVAGAMEGGPGLVSGLDEINHDLNVMTRYAMRVGGEVKSVTRNLDDVVQPYEWSG